MKAFTKFAILAFAMSAFALYGVSQNAPQIILKPLNLERGVVGPVSSNGSWSGFSELSLIPGAGLIPITSTSTVFYLGFTGGQTADVSNMVLYTAPRGGTKISAVTPVTLGGVSNPSIHLSTLAVCPVQPLSAGTPCIVRLDPVAFPLSALNDYYLVVFFTANDSNNSAIAGTVGTNALSSLTGWFAGSDQTQLTVGQPVPAGNAARPPYFLMYVMTH